MAQDEGRLLQNKAECPADGAATPDPWHDMLDRHGAEHGFHLRLGDRHGVLYTADARTLIVSFENAEVLRGTPTGLPLGLSVSGREGWSSLAVYSQGETWFRDPAVYSLFDTLIDECFFQDFDRVLFCGAGAGGYAAAAFSVAAPGADLLLIRPQATLDPARTEWDRRYPQMRRADWTGRYGYAPALAEAAQAITIVYDPFSPEDAMHAALFPHDHALRLRTPRLGDRIERDLAAMDLLMPMIRLAGKGHLSAQRFGKLYRRRRTHLPYLRRVLTALERSDRPCLAGIWARAALRGQSAPRLKKGLQSAEATLQAKGRSLPPARG